MNEIVLNAVGVSKLFPGVRALDHVDFDLRAGEVHILVGENGAGKSTLSKVLLGMYAPNAGKLILNGQEVQFHSPLDALNKGIVGVYQELTLIPYLSVAENIFLNREDLTRFHTLDKKKIQKKAKEILNSLNCDDIDVTQIVHNLSVAQQQLVEIAKALSYKPKIIVFDEPTSSLSNKEVESLFVQINKLKKAGLGIVYISHRMEEFPLIGDRITVMRDGLVIDTFDIAEHTQDEIVNMMVGRDVSQVYPTMDHATGTEFLRVEHLADDSGRVKDVSFKVRRGEIVGLAGLVGAGRTEAAQIIFGIRPLQKGHIFINGQKVVPSCPKAMIRQGISMIPEDRKHQGLAVADTIAWNISQVTLPEDFPYLLIQPEKIRKRAMDMKTKLNISCSSVNNVCKKLSGGNQQKVVLAKWLAEDTEMMIFDEPTRGIDVGAKAEIYQILLKLAKSGKAILLISSELSEVIGLSDHIYVVNEGNVTGECFCGEKNFNAESIGKMMLLKQEAAL